jgi:hypothetical protein
MYKVGMAIDEYMELVRAFPLVLIRDDRHLDQAIEVLHRLLDIPEHSLKTMAEDYIAAV